MATDDSRVNVDADCSSAHIHPQIAFGWRPPAGPPTLSTLQTSAMNDLFPMVAAGAPTMVFVDGQNLAMRYANMVKTMPEGKPRQSRGAVWYWANIAVWAQELRLSQAYGTRTNV